MATDTDVGGIGSTDVGPSNYPGIDKVTDSVLSDEAVLIFNWIMITVIGLGIDIFGIGTNIINIVCFIKQGFKDPVNISLLGLAFSDLGCLATLIWGSICYTPAFISADLPFHPIEVTYLISGIPHTTFTRVSGWITALITMERCLCITAPLKVKSIVTPQRVAAVIVCVFVILLASVAPVYAVNTLGTKYFPYINKTLIGLLFTKDRELIEKLSFAINNTFIPFSAYVIIIICTLVLVIKLRKMSKWRRETTTSEQANNVSIRNQNVAKMVLTISILFIICFIPLNVIFLAMSLEPRLSVDGTYRNMLILISGTGIVLESINSSVNIFIYYHMSSKHRNVLRQMFSLDANTEMSFNKT